MDPAQLISDALSIITISMCLFLKVPQIKSIYTLKNARGINIYALLMELSSYSVTALYNYVNNYSLLSYMEYPILILQEYVLVYLVLFYQRLLGTKSTAITTAYIAIVLAFLLGIIDGSALKFIIPLCTPISLSSKAIQLWEILKTRCADSVSVTTWAISAITNASRIYTIYMDSADLILLTNFSLSTIMSSSIALSAYVLQKKKTKLQ